MRPQYRITETVQSSAYITLSQRDTWADIQPIQQDDGPAPVVPIMYSEEYRDAMDYFRAISAAAEKSERALELTETIIRMNPAHYTVWQYRFATLIALNKSLEEELQLMNEFAVQNLKSYQVWHHRLLLLSAISPEDPAFEIDYIHRSLLPDPKNYHTWAYLHWLYSNFSTLGRISDAQWKEELAWCEEMLRVDGRNNSAWGWRWFLRVSRPGADLSTGAQKDELDYVLKAIHHIPHNVSAWNYLRGLLKSQSLPLSPLLPSVVPYTGWDSLSPADLESYSFPIPSDVLPKDTPLPVPLALEYLGDALAEQGKLDEAGQVFGDLSVKYDRMRAGYWELKRRQCVEQ
ncbi:protein farnesyltransferase/geranylgeranyltransferase type-1 subunit alpha [Cryptococcus wingfieldii CBS 7118]|uniref:Protein farnesyltransferase/geranylgeranyltransferase type-1 subunit alpha n=1 Tax=Cryptococcus wingfieldii CBS 7118 TaxID=1295528 RepID=A0A1E3I155_9TREE|nr:protein farnesyltransferase/geranylgeranyltransferase type-1 subunit alpha [Cryptococcus wingfieldii CBS 7118]ODN82329.1 protein farnesyltransferase/geranylgeranyltransferase type-1 subunit alpha [Cryptococcus wingfieldii CBS 7118]